MFDPTKFNVKTRFFKDVAHAVKRGMDMHRLDALLDLLASGEPLPPKYRAHKLLERDCWECHVAPDWLLVYKPEPDKVTLIQLGSHADIFR